MLYRIVKLNVLPKYRLEIEFENGAAGTIDLADDLNGPMFEPLRDEALFARASLDGFGVVCWPNGADYAPDAMYDIITGKADAGRSKPAARAGERR
jgi:Protein of unknown function (DUF2442)